ncbi:hypothetical protein [Mesorhizobium sp. AR02]|uniref:hypothetical protein n=1 Tax=Mesorhizobium sp. AR02 TaxID=2865837 RepID=UPI00215FDF89|nr:hypothetical protein [Mesorhizobium sp. AR02]
MISAAAGASPHPSSQPPSPDAQDTLRVPLLANPGVMLEKLPADAGMALKPPICCYAPDFPGVNKQIEEISVTKRKYRHRRSVDVRINWLQPHVDRFKEWLSQQNYSPATIVEVVRLLALWGDWVRATVFDIGALAVGFSASASVFQGSKSARAPQGAAALFVSYLREKTFCLQSCTRRWRRPGQHLPRSGSG